MEFNLLGNGGLPGYQLSGHGCLYLLEAEKAVAAIRTMLLFDDNYRGQRIDSA